MLTAVEEAALVARAQQGDQGAFVELVTAYRARTWAVCLRVTGNPFDAEDALQDALAAAWRHLSSFRNDSRFGTWLHRIASNASLAMIRKRRDTPVDMTEYEPAPGADEPTSTLAERDRLLRALHEIPEDFRVALVLREVGDFTYEEIATHQGIPVQTVKSRLNRARGRLAELLENS